MIVDGWLVDLAAHQITRGDITRRLEPKALQVLDLLVAQPGVVISRAELLRTVWGGAFVGDDAVSAAIIKLRRAFEDDARSPHVIETVHKSGYRLIASVVPGGAAERHSRQTQEGDVTRPTVKVATLLRCDVRIDWSESSSISPEKWQESADIVAGRIDEVIHRHGGQSIQESGAVLGVFGAPVAQEHHAMRAVQAAMEIREHAMAAAVRALLPLELSWQIALASGQILSSPASSDRRQAVHGAPLQRVLSLTTAALPGEILLAGETRELALGLLGVQSCEPRSHAVGVSDFCRLDDDARWSSPWEARVERGLTPLFGRTYEVDRLDTLLAVAAEGEGQVIALSGEPGAGKSRLVHESLLRASMHGYDSFVAAASPLEPRTSFFPLRGVLTDRLGLTPRVLETDAKLRSHLDQRATNHVEDVDALLAILHPDRVSGDWMTIDPELRRSRSLKVMLDVLIDDDQPSLIVFEDLHWADEATISLVDAIAKQIARRPCVLMITYRPDFIDPWATKSYSTQLRIDALGAADSGLMIDHLVGLDPTLERWKSGVVGRAGGTPLFIEEVVRSARSGGTLTGEKGELKLADRPASGSVPVSVHTLVADRIGRLSNGAGDILALAAVIGHDVPASLLDSLISGELSDRSDDLDELQAAELLFASRYQREPGYVFKHALTREVAYSEIPHSLRCEYHREVADFLEANPPAMAHVSPELLARHHSGGEQHEKATRAWINAAEAATSAAAFADALDHLDNARSGVARTTTGDREQLSLLIELTAASALVQSVGPADQAVDDAYQEARRLADSSGTAQQQYEAAWGLWFVHLMRGQIHAAQELGDELFELATDLDDEALKLEAHHVQWSGLSLAGDSTAVRNHTKIGIEQYRSEQHHWMTFSYGGHDPGVCARNLDAMALWLQGRPGRARARSASALSLADDLGHAYTRLESYNSALNIALLDGDADALFDHASALQALVDDGTLPEVASGYANGFRANALVLEGDLEAGLAIMRTDAPIWQEFWGAWCFPLDSALGTALALAGHVSEAIDHVQARLGVANESGALWWNAEFHRVLGELAWAHDPAEVGRAEASMQRALDEAGKQGASFLELRAATSLARLYRNTGRPREALDQLQATCSRFPSGVELTDLRDARAFCDELALE